jgi:hypothetical protein
MPLYLINNNKGDNMNYNKYEQAAKEAQQLRIHRIRLKLVTFQELVKPVLENKSMSYEQFLELNIACCVSDNYNDALMLNKLTVLYPVPSIQ